MLGMLLTSETGNQSSAILSTKIENNLGLGFILIMELVLGLGLI